MSCSYAKYGTRHYAAYLFTYYIDDILKRVFSEDIGCRIGVNKFNVLAYADDIVLFLRQLED